MTGKFITLEGPEGSGKTTVSKELVKILNESGSVSYTHLDVYKRQVFILCN